MLQTLNYCYAQLTNDQYKLISKSAKNYFSRIKTLSRDPDNVFILNELAANTFYANAQVIDDFLKGDSLINYMVYLNKVREFEGQLLINSSDYKYYYINKSSNSLGVVEAIVDIKSTRFTRKVTRNLIIDSNNGKILEIVNNTPKNASKIEFKPDEIKKITNNITVSENTTNSKKINTSKVVTDPSWLEMVFVKGGTFKMGSSREKDKLPLHEVNLSDFYIGKYEVTYDLWDRIIYGRPNPKVRCRNCPVKNVSYADVLIFIKRLNSKTRNNYRLPTEAEWEYAARGGPKSKGYKYAGSNKVNDVGWSNNVQANFKEKLLYRDISRKQTAESHPVGLKKPNELGIYDMSGNVWEYCSDWYSEDYYKESPQNNPVGPSSSFSRVCRGGSFNSKESYSQVFFRMPEKQITDNYSKGFRLVRDN